MSKMRMEIRQCPKGHFYSGEYDSCPFCVEHAGQTGDNFLANEVQWEPVQVPMEPGDYPKTEALNFDNGGFVQKQSEIEDYEATRAVPLEGESYGFDPVVGWLVCTGGPDRGVAYQLHSGTNFIGSSEKMDVCISGDQMISRTNAASISYDDRNKEFFLERGDVRNQVYVNGAVVRQYVDLVIYDRIAIGSSELIFVPLCGEKFSWKEIKG